MKTYRFEGDMDAVTMEDMKPLLEEIASCNDDVQLDLEAVTFIDSSGVGGLVFLFKRLRMRDLSLKIVKAKGQPQKLFLQLRLGFLLDSSQEASAA
ncbi:MAG: putative anti-sigma factor antagonist [Hyphomicrobiales bacterium]|nr:putative anti-sigma factor antagonist [Hyphomicrobiales bacterium]